jgi:hypothetical protein
MDRTSGGHLGRGGGVLGIWKADEGDVETVAPDGALMPDIPDAQPVIRNH